MTTMTAEKSRTLTSTEAYRMRELYVEGKTTYELAEMFEVARPTVGEVLTGELYADVPGTLTQLRPRGRPRHQRGLEEELVDLRLAVDFYPDHDGLLGWLDRKGWMAPEDAIRLGLRLDAKDEIITTQRRQLADKN